MTWLATLHGDLDHLPAEAAAAAEAAVRDALARVAGSLAAEGHQGVGATFQGSAGTVDLVNPPAPPAAPAEDGQGDQETALEPPQPPTVDSAPEGDVQAATIG